MLVRPSGCLGWHLFRQAQDFADEPRWRSYSSRRQPAAPPKLLGRMRVHLRTRHYSIRTEQALNKSGGILRPLDVL